VLALMIVTVGGEIGQEIQRLYERDAYRDYLVLHGFSVEMTEALAECIHDRVRRQLGIEPAGSGEGHVAVVRSYPGRRYSFGYAACPDLSQQETVVRLLAADQIGVRLSEGHQMVPEQSVSAIIVHHPQAQYFSV
jgi:5-methyltetrahydrofolate--homocysteine methyltransferase